MADQVLGRVELVCRFRRFRITNGRRFDDHADWEANGGVSGTTVGSFVATTGQKPWPSVGSFVAAYGSLFMAADIHWAGNLPSGGPARTERALSSRKPRPAEAGAGFSEHHVSSYLNYPGVGEKGVEPSPRFQDTDLNRARLPFRHSPEQPNEINMQAQRD